MKHLLRCCRLHESKRLRQALGQLFAIRGRTCKYYVPFVHYSGTGEPANVSPVTQAITTILAQVPEGVRHWITQATVSLCDDARKRIASEITAHCQDGLNALEASGLSRIAAEERVLEGLGDPVQANAAFQKTYLTSAQERFMAPILQHGQTQYQALHAAMFLFCALTLLKSLLTLARALGLFDMNAGMFLPMLGYSIVFLIRSGRGSFNEKVEQRYLERVKRPLDRNTLWILFALLACLYAYLETLTRSEAGFLPCIVITVPFLYATAHRTIIRDIIAFFPNMPRVRTYLMFGYSGILFGLAFVATRFFQWILMLHRDDSFRSGMDPFFIFVGLATPIVIGLLWFGGHALLGAFFVSKAKPAQTACSDTPLGE